MDLPDEIFLVFVDHGPAIGKGNGDFTETPDDAADQVAEAWEDGRDYRVLRLCGTVASDATEEITAIVKARLLARAYLEAAE